MRKAYLKMHLAIFLWGFTGLFGKLIQLNEGLIVWYRMLISSVVIAFIVTSRKSFPKLARKDLFRISGIGFLVMIHWITFYGSIKLSSISVAMICLSSIALFASIFEPLVNRKKFDYMEIVFSAVAMLGIFTIYHSEKSAAAGIVVGVISAFFSAVFSTFNARIASKHEPLTISLVELTSGMALLTILFPVYFLVQRTTKFLPDATDLLYLVLLSVVCTVFTWVLSLQALRKVSAYTMGLALNLEPIYGIILAILFTGEGRIMNKGFITGAAIILLTVTLHTFYKFYKYRLRKKAL